MNCFVDAQDFELGLPVFSFMGNLVGVVARINTSEDLKHDDYKLEASFGHFSNRSRL